jgi:hypothetical protein
VYAASGHDTAAMTVISEKPIFHVVLTDRDEWAVEVEWGDGTLERISTFKAHILATTWVSTRSDAWLKVRNIFYGSASETP